MVVEWTYTKAMKIIPELIVQEPNEQLKNKLQGMLKAMEAESRKLKADLEALPSTLDSVETQLLPYLVDLSNLVFFCKSVRKRCWSSCSHCLDFQTMEGNAAIMRRYSASTKRQWTLWHNRRWLAWSRSRSVLTSSKVIW